jgi:hypothetical protein
MRNVTSIFVRLFYCLVLCNIVVWMFPFSLCRIGHALVHPIVEGNNWVEVLDVMILFGEVTMTAFSFGVQLGLPVHSGQLLLYSCPSNHLALLAEQSFY